MEEELKQSPTPSSINSQVEEPFDEELKRGIELSLNATAVAHDFDINSVDPTIDINEIASYYLQIPMFR